MSDNASERVRQSALAAIGNREVTWHDVLHTTQTVAPACGYIFGVDEPLGKITDAIVMHNIPDQIIEI